MKYKKGDKVVIEIDDIRQQCFNTLYLTKSTTLSRMFLNDDNILGKLEDFQPTKKKIKMTVEEKKEFDKLKERYVTPYAAMSNMFKDNAPHLFKKVNTHESDEKRAQNQFEFFKAFEHPELIEVVKEKKYKIKILNGYLYNISRNSYKIADRIDYGDIFTQSEIDGLQKQEQFKAIDLNKCKEDVEDEI